MKIASITMVKNEEEIIESFIRYNIDFMESMHIIDNGCTDRTIDILHKLQQEGMNIYIYNESFVDFEVLYIENKYLNIVSNKSDADFLVNLDADEFLASYEDMSVQLKKLETSAVYRIALKHYVLHESDNKEEHYVPLRMCHCIEPKKNTSIKEYTKVIVPAQMVREHKVLITTGHHDVKLIEKGIEVHDIFNLFMAHFPITSYEQLITKSIGSYNNFIAWMSRIDGEGEHINRVRDIIISNDKEKIDLVLKYGYMVGKANLEDYEVSYKPIKCIKKEIKYSSIGKLDVIRYFINQAEILGLKFCNEKQSKKYRKENIKILIYGTGSFSDRIYSKIMSQDRFDIMAWVDSNSKKAYMKKNGIVIIPPERIKFFNYDKILIASSYYKEIYNTLLLFGVVKEDIVGEEYLF